MATLAPSRATAASMELRNLSSLSTASHKAAEQLTSILNTAEVLISHCAVVCTHILIHVPRS